MKDRWQGQLLFLLLSVGYSSLCFAVTPEVKFRGYTDGCKSWYKPDMMVSFPEHCGPAESGQRHNEIDWTQPVTQMIDPHAFNYLRVKGSNQFGKEFSGIGEANLSLHVQSLETGDFKVKPWAVVYPSGGAEISVALNLASIPEEDQDLCFLVYRQPQYSTQGAWVDVQNRWIILEHKLKVSASARTQIQRKEPSVIHASAFFDFSKDLHPGVGFKTGDQEFSISYRIISPELCTLEERLKDPVAEFSILSAEELLQSVVCMQLIPSSRTQSHLSWSERKNQIHPRLNSLKQFRENPSVLDRFETKAFRDLIIHIIDHKLKSFYQWAFHNFEYELNLQSGMLRDLSRTLNSQRNPTSYRRMLETYKRYVHDVETRNGMIQEFLQMNQERRGLSASSGYHTFLDQVDHFFQNGQVDINSIDTLIEQTEELAKKFEEQADTLVEERNEYERHK